SSWERPVAEALGDGDVAAADAVGEAVAPACWCALPRVIAHTSAAATTSATTHHPFPRDFAMPRGYPRRPAGAVRPGRDLRTRRASSGGSAASLRGTAARRHGASADLRRRGLLVLVRLLPHVGRGRGGDVPLLRGPLAGLLVDLRRF